MYNAQIGSYGQACMRAGAGGISLTQNQSGSSVCQRVLSLSLQIKSILSEKIFTP